MKVVIDTNLLIDGVADDYSFSNRIIDAVLGGKIEAYANQATLRENRLLSDRRITDERYLDKLNRYFAAVRLAPNVDRRLRVVSDPDDNKLLESAVASDVDYLVSSDRHLLDLGEYEGIKIVTPAEFWSHFEDETEDTWASWVNQFMN